jgi:hypothetical protein
MLMSPMGLRRFERALGMSAIHPIAAESLHYGNRHFVPKSRRLRRISGRWSAGNAIEKMLIFEDRPLKTARVGPTCNLAVGR